MQTSIAILRGINVGGRNKIRMTDLSTLFERLKFRDVRTYIQSGNVIFRSGKEANEKVAARIEKAILNRFGYTVPVLVRTAEEMRTTVAANPFLKERGINVEGLHVTFLAAKPEPAFAENVIHDLYPPDRYALVGRDVYLHCPEKYGGSKLSNAFFERKLKVRATTRNWKTVTTLLEMAT